MAQARLLAGLTSVADWIGSGHFFENPSDPWQPRIAQALDEAGFVPPRYQSGLSFHDVFGFAPRDAQTQLIDAVGFAYEPVFPTLVGVFLSATT